MNMRIKSINNKQKDMQERQRNQRVELNRRKKIMTEEQFNEVLAKAIELQEQRVSKRTVNGARTRMVGFEKETKKATKLHAACIFNDICLEMDGSYNLVGYNEVRNLYLRNVQLVKNYK